MIKPTNLSMFWFPVGWSMLNAAMWSLVRSNLTGPRCRQTPTF
jgi:hypothetical protein